MTGCAVNGCITASIYPLVRKYNENKRGIHQHTEELLQNIVFERDDFKADFKVLKNLIKKVKSSLITSEKLTQIKRKALIQKHIYSINYLQQDMNKQVSAILKSQETKDLNSSLRVFRKKASDIYRKYNISTRDLYNRHKLQSNWRLRSLLQQHRRISMTGRYRFGIRIYPGGRDLKVDAITE